MFDQNLIIGLVVLALVVMALYSYAPRIRSMLSGMGIEMFVSGVGPAGKKQTALQKAGKGVAGASLGALSAPSEGAAAKGAALALPTPKAVAEKFSDFQGSPIGDDSSMGGVPMAGAKKPQGCYPREQMNPTDLLPLDTNSQWAQANPAGSGDIQGKNFLSAGALVGVNTIGQSMRNANYQIRSEPPNPQVQVGPWMQSTMEQDLQRRPLE